MFVVLDALLIAAAALIMITGLARRRYRWRSRTGLLETGNWADLIAYLACHKIIRRKPWTGLAHLALVWGFGIFLIVVALDQIDVLMPENQAFLVSIVLDLTGLMMLLAVIFFLLKNRLSTSKSSQSPVSKKRLLPLIVLILVLLSGFLAEGARISLQNTGFDMAAPLGSVISLFMIDSPVVMQLMIRLHFYLVLLFFALIPYTFMRHIVSSSSGVLQKTPNAKPISPQLIPPNAITELGEVEEIGWRHILGVEACVSCHRCTEHCPAAISGKNLIPADMMQQALQKMEANSSGILCTNDLETVISPDTIWSCTTCLACIEQCPVYSRPMDLILMMRRHRVLARGDLPEEALPMIRNLELYGDTMGKGATRRADWSIDLDILSISDNSEKTEMLLWAGCAGSFHPENRKTLQALVSILKKGDRDFKILGSEELCCGEPARKLGNETLFQELALQNIDRLKRHKFEEIVTLCPHCYHTLKNEYPDFGGEFKIRHAAEVVLNLINNKQIELKYAPRERQITIHDPCYLARTDGPYRSLRIAIGQVPGSQLIELPHNCKNTSCCGGGGGHMWLHENQGRKTSLLRAEEVDASGAELLVTACPYCQVMMKDGIAGLEKKNAPKVKDLIEVIADAIG